jgi:P-type Cu2+ transporter
VKADVTRLDRHTAPGNHTGHAGHAGHDQHAGHSTEMFKQRFWLSLLLTIPIVATSGSIMEWFRYTLDFPGIEWVAPVLGTAVFLYGGTPFLVGAVREVRARKPGMMLLIGMAITVAFVASWLASLELFAVEVWWETSLLIVIMLLGHWLEMRALGPRSPSCCRTRRSG